MAKLDPTLLVMLRRHEEARRSAPREEAGFRPPPARADMAVKFTGDIADLIAAGFEPRTQARHPTEGFTIATGSIPVARLTALAQVPHLVQAEASRPMQPELNRSVPEIHADEVHENLSLKGAGVVVGIIDSGFDMHHHNFRAADGTTRLLALWDQTISPTDPDALPGEAAPTNFPNLGVEYNQARINAALTTDRRLVRTNDREDDGDVDGHGSRVAGIAAGDGSQAGNCRGQFTFVGVAPEADLIVVRLRSGTFELGASSNLIDAFDWIWNHPRTAGRPVVVNLSQGDNVGAHDGTSLVEQYLGLHVLTNPGHVVVKSAGNEGDTKRHAEATIAPGDTVNVGFEVAGGDGRNRHIDIWYSSDSRFDVQLVAPVRDQNGNPRTSQVFSAPNGGADPPWVVNPGVVAANRRTRVEVTAEVELPNNGQNRIHILIDPAARATIPAGPWTLRLTNRIGPAARFDAWLERGTKAPFFTSHVTTARTISVPGTARDIITVGSYSQSGFLFFNWSGDVAASSSRGPTWDGRTKPELSAPGVGITSVAAEETDNCCCDCCENFYLEKDGTSYAAPHVAGVVALMLQKNPRLPAIEARRILMETARPHGGGSPGAPDNVIGAGKLNAKAAVDATPSPAPAQPGSPGGGGGGGSIGAAEIGEDSGNEAPDLSLREWFESPAGQLVAALVSRHLSEVRRLVNHNKRVGAFWRLARGPELLRGGAGLVRRGDAPVPAQLDVDELARRVPQFLHVLEKHGSERLRQDLRRHGPALVRLALAGASRLNQLVDRAA